MSALLDLETTIERLTHGGVVALPTDTVYGVAASLGAPDAVERLFSLKRRPSGLALPVLLDAVDDLVALGVTWPERARRLSEAYWPGSLTIIVDAPATLATLVGATSSVGFRVPEDDLARLVLRACGPLAVSSANLHGAEPCHDAPEVLDVLGDVLDGVLDGGRRDRPASTVVDLTGGAWRVRRVGSVATSRIAALLD